MGYALENQSDVCENTALFWVYYDAWDCIVRWWRGQEPERLYTDLKKKKNSRRLLLKDFLFVCLFVFLNSCLRVAFIWYVFAAVKQDEHGR